MSAPSQPDAAPVPADNITHLDFDRDNENAEVFHISPVGNPRTRESASHEAVIADGRGLPAVESAL